MHPGLYLGFALISFYPELVSGWTVAQLAYVSTSQIQIMDWGIYMHTS